MKYLDTNILIRLITGDDPSLASRAAAILDAGEADEFTVLDAVIVEVCFVLEFHAYSMKRSDIADALETLMNAPQIAAAAVSLRALTYYRMFPKLDYTDCLLMATAGASGVVTFDKTLHKALQKL